jgi:hypothetical protein
MKCLEECLDKKTLWLKKNCVIKLPNAGTRPARRVWGGEIYARDIIREISSQEK